MILTNSPQIVYLAHWVLDDGRIIIAMTNKASFDRRNDDSYIAHRIRRFNSKRTRLKGRAVGLVFTRAQVLPPEAA